MSYYKDRLGFDPDEPTANGDGTGTTTSSRKSKRGYEENLSKFKGLSHIIYCLTIQSRAVYDMRALGCIIYILYESSLQMICRYKLPRHIFLLFFWRRSKTRSTVNAVGRSVVCAGSGRARPIPLRRGRSRDAFLHGARVPHSLQSSKVCGWEPPDRRAGGDALVPRARPAVQDAYDVQYVRSVGAAQSVVRVVMSNPPRQYNNIMYL